MPQQAACHAFMTDTSVHCRTEITSVWLILLDTFALDQHHNRVEYRKTTPQKHPTLKDLPHCTLVYQAE